MLKFVNVSEGEEAISEPVSRICRDDDETLPRVGCMLEDYADAFCHPHQRLTTSAPPVRLDACGASEIGRDEGAKQGARLAGLLMELIVSGPDEIALCIVGT